MKKILVTGCTGQQCGKVMQINYEAVSTVFAHGLTLAGYDVERRPYQLSDDISDFDAIFLGFVPFFSVAGHFVNTALACLADAEKCGVPVVIYFDDWRFPQLFSNFRSLEKNGIQQLVKPFFNGRDGYAWAKDNLELLERVVTRLCTENWPVTLAPSFSWGDRSLFTQQLPMSADLVLADISALAMDLTPAEVPEKRETEWVLGTLSNQVEWLESLNLTWPVRHFGGRASKASTKLTEPQLVAEYYSNWGVLSPPYKKILGTGWWRNRFVHAARAKAILLCDPGEAPALGEPYAIRPSVIEAMTPAELHDVAQAQHDVFMATQASHERAIEQVRSAATLAAERLE